jgi:hypothetical protein
MSNCEYYEQGEKSYVGVRVRFYVTVLECSGGKGSLGPGLLGLGYRRAGRGSQSVVSRLVKAVDMLLHPRLIKISCPYVSGL